MIETLLQGSSTIEGDLGNYRMEWPDLHLTALISRIKDNSNNEIHGEIDIKSERPTSAGHLKGGKLNITSVNSRHQWALSLAKRDSEIDWDALLEQLYMKVKAKHREGAPIEDLDGDADVEAEDVPWIIEPILQENNASIIYGHGSAGKSWFAQYLAILADLGLSHGGLHVEPSKVLYLDWETDRKELNLRITKIKAGLKVTDKTNIKYRFMSDSLINDLQVIKEKIMEHGITLLIIDSVGAACGGEPENAKVVHDFFNAIRKLRVTTLCIDHMNKENGLFGSVFKYNRSRLVWEVKKHQEQNSSTLHVGFFHKKANNVGHLKDMGFELSFTKEAIAVERKDIRDTPLETEMSPVQRIDNVIRAFPGGLSPIEIAQEIQAHGDPREIPKITNQVNNLIWQDKQKRESDRRWLQQGDSKKYVLNALFHMTPGERRRVQEEEQQHIKNQALKQYEFETAGSGQWKPETF